MLAEYTLKFFKTLLLISLATETAYSGIFSSNEPVNISDYAPTFKRAVRKWREDKNQEEQLLNCINRRTARVLSTNDYSINELNHLQLEVSSVLKEVSAANKEGFFSRDNLSIRQAKTQLKKAISAIEERINQNPHRTHINDVIPELRRREDRELVDVAKEFCERNQVALATALGVCLSAAIILGGR